MKLQEGNVSMSVCVILFVGGMHPEDGMFHMGFPPPKTDSQWAGM